jgi:hypothetical protein
VLAVAGVSLVLLVLEFAGVVVFEFEVLAFELLLDDPQPTSSNAR